MATARSRRPPTAALARRWLAVVLIGLIGYAYYHPLRSWFEARHELETRRAEVASLAAERHALQERLEASASLDTVGHQARQLGYIRPGEHLFIVKGIQAWKKAHSTIPADGR